MKMKVSLNLGALKKIWKPIRKQLPLVICGIVAAASVVLAYWPTQGWFTDLASKVQASVGFGSQLDGLTSKTRQYGGVTLPCFPTQQIIDAGASAVSQVNTASMGMLNQVSLLNVHIPLDVDLDLANASDPDIQAAAARLLQGGPAVPSVLTTGRNQDVPSANWIRAYVAAMTDDSRIRNWPTPDVAQIRRVYGYPVPPLLADQTVTQTEIQNALAELQTNINNQYLIRDNTGAITSDSQAAATNQYASQSVTLPLQMEVSRANKCKVYMQPGAIVPPTIYASLAATTTTAAASDIFSAQLVMWVEEDVASAVARANADAHDVTESPVKQIVNLNISNPPYLISSDPSAGSDSASLTPAPDFTPTGRVSNGMYDVMQFTLVIDVDATKVPQVLDSLQSGQFITVDQVTTAQQIDSSDKALQGFVFGKAPIVELTLVCEDLYLRSWTTKYQPDGAGAPKYFSGGAAGGGGGGGAPAVNMLTITTH